MTSSDKQYPCPDPGCKKSFSTPHGLKVHFTRKHNRNKPKIKGFRKSKKDDE